jgi:phosphatidylinositol alpha-1,6-mannosyltransferase
MNRDEVAIIVLNRNRGKDLLECLDSIYGSSHRRFEVIVVDNASTDGSVELVKAWASGVPETPTGPGSGPNAAGHAAPGQGPAGRSRVTGSIPCRHLTVSTQDQAERLDVRPQGYGGARPGLTVISAPGNLGFAGGHNLGLTIALKGSADFVLLLNSDMVVDRDFLEPLLSELADGRIGAAGPVVLYHGDPTRIWQAGGEIFPARGSSRRRFAERRLEAVGSESIATRYLPGCAVLFRRAALESVGLLDEDYFLYFEDTDWFARAAKLGWEFRMAPGSKVWHKETLFGMTAKSVSAAYYFSRNRLMFIKKNYPAHMPSALLWSLRYGILNNLYRRRWWHLRMSLKGMWDFFHKVKGRCESASAEELLQPGVMVFSADYKPRPGGIAEHAYKIACHFRARGARVVVLAPAFEGHRDFDGCAPFETYRVARLPVLDLVVYLFVAFHLIVSRRVGLVYCATSHPCGWICRLLRPFVSFRFTVTIHAHEVVYSSRGLRQRIKRAMRPLQGRWIGSADRVLAVSNFTRLALVKAGVDESRISVVFNGIDPGDFAGITGTQELVRRYGLGRRRVILTVARLDVHKGHDVVIKAMPRILEKIPDAAYVIVGEGSTRPGLEALCRKYGVHKQVIFTGLIPRHDVLGLFAACDVFVMISRIEGSNAEGFGIVFLEAGALSKPVVGGRAGGVTDAVEDGVTGYLVDPLDSGGVAEAVVRVLLDRNLASRLGSNGRERVLSRFTWDHIFDRIVDAVNAAG